MFSENKINAFANPVAKLADRPQISAQALKAWFDSSAEEVRVKFNAVLDELDSFAADSFVSVAYTGGDGKLTFTFGNGSIQEIDLPLELLIKSGHYDADAQTIVLVLANGDTLTIPVSDLVDEYEADEKTLHMAASETSRIFSVKDGVFAPEAPADNKLYARKNKAWTEIVEGLPELVGDVTTTFSGIYKYDGGVLVATHDFGTYDTDGDDIEDTYDFYAYQLWIRGDGIKKRAIEDLINTIPEGGFPVDENGGVDYGAVWAFGYAWEGLYDNDIADLQNGKQDLPTFERRFDITYASQKWVNQPAETVDTSVFSTEEIYRVCRKNESGGTLSGKFRLMTKYDGHASPIKNASGNAIEFTVTSNTPAHNGIVSFNNISGKYRFFTPDCSAELILPRGYIYDIYLVADIRGDLGGGTVMTHNIGSGKQVLFMNGGTAAGIAKASLALMTGTTTAAEYKRLFNHTQLTYSKGLIACNSSFRSVNKTDPDDVNGTNAGGSYYSSCAQAIDCELTSAVFNVMLHPESGSMTAQERGVFFKGTQIFVTGRKINDKA